LRTALRERPGLRLVVVGAGWIGAEIAGVAAGAGADVTVVEAAPAALSRQLGQRVGAHLAPWYDAAGVRLRTGAPVAAVRPDGVTLASGEELPADLVLAAVGARPASGWLAGTLPLDARGGLRVDETGAVPGQPRVWAVGDVASRAHPVVGTVPGGHWSAALHDPDAPVRAMLGVGGGTHHAPVLPGAARSRLRRLRRRPSGGRRPESRPGRGSSHLRSHLHDGLVSPSLLAPFPRRPLRLSGAPPLRVSRGRQGEHLPVAQTTASQDV
jgi:NADPH-dependent 2,4-dienoyl-CoA reductase/sulfur reductase-like enzyme